MRARPVLVWMMLVALLWWAPSARAADKEVEKKAEPPKQAAEKEAQNETEPPVIEDVLEERATIDFDAAPLTDVIAFLKEHYNIPVDLDRDVLEEAGIAVETPITSHLKDIPLRSALSRALDDIHLDWLIRDDVLLITTRDVADQMMLALVYDVSDVVPAGKPDGDGSDVSEALDQLSEMLQAVVAPQSWSDTGASIRPLHIGQARMLIIYQNRRAHDEINLLLDEISFTIDATEKRPENAAGGAHAKVTRHQAAQAEDER
jgi:hypothetical protein